MIWGYFEFIVMANEESSEQRSFVNRSLILFQCHCFCSIRSSSYGSFWYWTIDLLSIIRNVRTIKWILFADLRDIIDHSSHCSIEIDTRPYSECHPWRRQWFVFHQLSDPSKSFSLSVGHAIVSFQLFEIPHQLPTNEQIINVLRNLIDNQTLNLFAPNRSLLHAMSGSLATGMSIKRMFDGR